jgi:trans-aconitate methyltransferase
MSSEAERWNAELYQSSHSYVWTYGRDLLALLDPKPDERILDVGSGTGQLTDEAARSGAEVIGVDSSPEMVVEARKNHPQIRFDIADATALPFHEEFDAAMSNAALHWIRDHRAALRSIARALKPGGRFVFEMGGHRNLHATLRAGTDALRSLSISDPEKLIPWRFPSIGDYAPLLESAGFEVKYAAHIDRPTKLSRGEAGLRDWIEMFGGYALSAVAPTERDRLIQRWEDLARPVLFRDGAWIADYKRLRMVAVKS